MVSNTKQILTEDTSENVVFQEIRKSCFAKYDELQHNISDLRKGVCFNMTLLLKFMFREELYNLQ